VQNILLRFYCNLLRKIVVLTITMGQEVSDLEIIENVLNGETKQYALLVKRHQRFVFTLALRFTRSREEAEEIAQDCFVKAYKALGAYKNTAKFSTWLYTITYTTAMTFLRKKRVNTLSIYDEQTYLHLENQTSNFNADVFEKRDIYTYLNLAISRLAEDDATIVMLFYKGEQSLEEIGAILNMDANNIKVKLHRARQRLKIQLQLLLKEEVKQLL
jgi:RNA polymerase sigma factor (sigma-70 family)